MVIRRRQGLVGESRSLEGCPWALYLSLAPSCITFFSASCLNEVKKFLNHTLLLPCCPETQNQVTMDWTLWNHELTKILPLLNDLCQVFGHSNKKFQWYTVESKRRTIPIFCLNLSKKLTIGRDHPQRREDWRLRWETSCLEVATVA
jgi:hypothetical protein